MSFPPPLLVKAARHSTWSGTSGDGPPLLSPDRDRIEEKDRERILAMNAHLQATSYVVATALGDDFHVGAPASELLVDVGGWKVGLTVNPRTGQLLVQARPPSICPHHRQPPNAPAQPRNPAAPSSAAAATQNPSSSSPATVHPEGGEVRCKLFRCCAVKSVPTPMPPPPASGSGGERSGRRVSATVVNNPVFNNPKLRKIIGPSSPARSRRSRSRSRGRRKNTPNRGDTIHPSSSHSPPPSPPPSSSSLSSSPSSSSSSLALTRVSGELASIAADVTPLNFNMLPEEVQLHVFSFLSPVDVLSIVPATCRHWRDLTQDETLWKVLQEEHFGGPRRSDRSWHQECILGLTRIKRQTQRYQTEMLLWGAKHGHTQFVRRMLREFNIDVNVRSHKSEASPLHLAAAQGHYDTIELLLSCGADVNARTSYGRTPLERAARYGHAAVVQLLLFRGASVNSTTEGGETPLLMAAGNNHKKVVKILLRHDADVTAASAGFTALRIATLQGYTEIVQLLHQHAQQTAAGGGAPSSALSLAAASSLMPA